MNESAFIKRNEKNNDEEFILLSSSVFVTSVREKKYRATWVSKNSSKNLWHIHSVCRQINGCYGGVWEQFVMSKGTVWGGGKMMTFDGKRIEVPDIKAMVSG